MQKVSQNVRGISKEVSKLESIVSLMVENNVDACLFQETWLVGSGVKVVSGITLFYYGLANNISNRG